MQLSVTVTSLSGALVIQDPHPVSGIFSKTVPAGGASTFTCDWSTWHRLSAQVEAYRVAGLCTVALAEVTPTGTDSTSGSNTTYNKSDWALLNSFRKDISALQAAVGGVTNALQDKGAIALATDFPLVADVEDGWFYTITADVTDNAGVTYTNTGLVFLAGSEIVWNGSTWISLGADLSSPLQYKGSITLAADFPIPTGSSGVKAGHCYLIAAPVVDNDPSKTNTSATFTTGDVIQWNGVGWNIFAAQNSLQFRGAISIASEFPTLSLVKTGHVYTVTANVTDSDGTRTNTGQSFLAGDVIAWYSSAWRLLSSTAVEDYNIAAKATAVDIMTDESEKTAVLSGVSTKQFVPTHLVIKVATVTGTPATPGAINVGTSTGGTDIASGTLLTGLILAGDTRVVPLPVGTFNIAGNATLYVNVETAEATASVMTCDVWVKGFQV